MGMAEQPQELIVNLEEFADLCGVTGETMRAHLKVVEGEPIWLLERGDRGRGYKIEARGGVAWWRAKRGEEEQQSAERRAQLAQLRLDLVGDQVEAPAHLGMSGKQRREEYAAGEAALKYRKLMGDLIDRNEMVHELSSAAANLRRRLLQVPGEFAIREGLSPQSVVPLEGMLGRAVDEFLRAVVEGTAIEIYENRGPNDDA